MARRCESSEEMVATTQANRKAPTVRGALKEAASEPVEPTNRNWRRGVAEQGERAKDREALATKAQAA